MLVDANRDHVALTPGHLDGNDLLGKSAIAVRGHGPLMGLQSPFILLLARDGVVASASGAAHR